LKTSLDTKVWRRH